MWKANGPLKWMIAAILCLYTLFSLGTIVAYPMMPSHGMKPNWVIPTIVLSVVLIGVLYFFLFFWGAAFVLDADRGMEHRIGEKRFSAFQYAGIECTVSKADRFEPLSNEKARRFGSRRTVSYEVSSTWFDKS